MRSISPTQFNIWSEDQEQWYRQYILKEARDPQTEPMAIGSAFDAYVKIELHRDLKIDYDMELERLFQDQIEEQNLEWAIYHGQHAIDQYKRTGAYDGLIRLLHNSENVGLDSRLEGTVDYNGQTILVNGRPDLHFYIGDRLVVADWKVNGYCNGRTNSPAQGYLKLYPDGTMHKACVACQQTGIWLNKARNLETFKKDWANQLSIYSWLLGNPVDKPFIGVIDQLACKSQVLPVEIRVAHHRCFISAEYQVNLFHAIKNMLDIVESDWIFRDMSLEESQARCESLKLGHWSTWT